ncbi:MAG: hypothetical protein ACLS4Z_06580, partial [Christensenellaceae bacterium]
PQPEAIDYDLLAEKVAENVSVEAPEITIPEPETIDYELLSEKVAEKVVLPDVEIPQPEELDYELLAQKVAEKIVVPQAEVPTYDVVVDEDGARSIAECVAASIDFDVFRQDCGKGQSTCSRDRPARARNALDYEVLSDKVAER